MNQSIEIIPAILVKTTDEAQAQGAQMSSFASMVHVDMDDGLFVPWRSFPYVSDGKIDNAVSLSMPLAWEAHLMVKDPLPLAKWATKSGASRIVAHLESCWSAADSIFAVVSLKKAGVETSLSLLLQTPLTKAFPIIKSGFCDSVQMMTIAHVGMQGVLFEGSSYGRIFTLRDKFPDLILGADGGIKIQHIAPLIEAGVSRFVIGSAISRAENPKAAYAEIQAETV